MLPRSLSALFSAIAIAAAARGALEFSGYIKSSDGLRFVVTDLSGNKTSGWLQIGDTFQAHKLVGFDSPDQVLILDHGGATVRLSLKEAQVKSSKSAPQKAEVHVSVSAEGNLTIDGKSVDDEAFRALLRKLAENGTPVALLVQEPPNPTLKTHEAVKNMSKALQEVVVRKWSIRVLD